MPTTTEIELGIVVEGHGEIKAIPALVRRIAAIEQPNCFVHTREVFRVSRDKLVKPGELERTIEFVARRLSGSRAILVTVDTDGDLPCILGPALLARATKQRTDLPIGVALAHQEFETWFLAGAESLRGLCDLPADLVGPTEPEAVRGAKEWLSKKMTAGRPYRETTDQELLAKKLDIVAARKARSFDKFYREVVRLCDLALHQGTSE